MELTGLDKLGRLTGKKKHRGDTKFMKAVTKFKQDIKDATWKNQVEMLKDRPDFDSAHPDGFYFTELNVHRAMIMVEFISDLEDEGEVELLWAGTHNEYISTFGNNKDIITKWLRTYGRIS